MRSKISFRVTLISVMIVMFGLLSHTLIAGQVSSVVVTPENKAEDVIFPLKDVLVAIDYAGLNNITAKMNAFSVPDGSILWHLESKVGKRYQMLQDRVFFDYSEGWFFIGNGPLSAIDAATGDLKWTIDFKETGVVRWVRSGKNRLILLGADRESDVNDYDGLKKHFEKPKLICVNKGDGSKIWEYKFEHPEDLGDVHVLHVPVDVGDYAFPPDYSQGKLLIKGKKLCCIRTSDGVEIWKTEKDSYGAPGIDANTIYANVDKRITALNIENGKEMWKFERKVDKTSIVISAGTDMLMALNPGEFKDGKNTGSYKLYGISCTSGKLQWEFTKGKDFTDLQDVTDGTIFMADKDNYRAIQVNDGKEVFKKKRNEDFGMGSWYLGDMVLDVGEKGICCSDRNRDKVLWEAKHKRAKHGKSFMLSVLKGLSTLTTSVSMSYRSGDPYRDRMSDIRQSQIKRDREKMAEKYSPTERDRYESELWKPPLENPSFGTVALVDSEILFPTHDMGVVAISTTDGKVLWEVKTTSNDPWLYFSPDLTAMAVVDEENLHIISLSR